MQLIRLRDMDDKRKRSRINYFFSKGRLTKHIDDEGFVCYDADEFAELRPVKTGRRIKITNY